MGYTTDEMIKLFNYFSKYYHSVGETKEEEKIIRKTEEEELNISHNELRIKKKENAQKKKISDIEKQIDEIKKENEITMMKEKCSTEIEEEELKNNLEIESINNENKKEMELKRIKYEEQLLLKQNNIENMRNEMMLQMLANQIFILNNQN